MSLHTSPPLRRGSSRASAVIGIALGLLAITLAGPRLYVEAATLVARAAVIRAQAGGSTQTPNGFDPDKMRSLAVLLENAGRTSGSPTAHSLAGQAHLLLADHAVRNGESAEASVERAAEALIAAVAANPADPYGWARLPHAEHRRGRPAAAAKAWHMSVLTGSYEPDLMERRLIQGWALQDWLEPTARDAFEEQVKLFWQQDPGRTALFAHRHEAAALVRRLLIGDPAALDDFDLRYSRIPAAGSAGAPP